MEAKNWTGQIMCNKRKSELVNFLAKPDLMDILKKMENRSEFIREAVREKLKEESLSYSISKIDYEKYNKNDSNLYKV